LIASRKLELGRDFDTHRPLIHTKKHGGKKAISSSS